MSSQNPPNKCQCLKRIACHCVCSKSVMTVVSSLTIGLQVYSGWVYCCKKLGTAVGNGPPGGMRYHCVM